MIELFIERVGTKSIVGNIYKGKVVKVLPGMQSAFVEIGMKKAAFIHVSDMNPKSVKELDSMGLDSKVIEDEDTEDVVVDKTELIELEVESSNNIAMKYPSIEEQISESEEIVVQVTKNYIGAKGARLVKHISIPGRFIVLMPNSNHIGVSRKIESSEERERLVSILEEICPKGYGLIARTVSSSVSRDQLEDDLDILLRIIQKLDKDIETAKAPSKLYEDHDLIFKILRDIASPEVSKIIIDSKEDYEKMSTYLEEYMPKCEVNIEYYENNKVSLFDAYNIELEIDKILDKKVWLKSGGYIVVDYTEALTVIDVNTGKFVGSYDFNDTILKTNLEAAKEIALQLKLRNIGGIIIIDFIDMEPDEDKAKVLSVLEEHLKGDRAKALVIDITILGLVEITRKRVQEPVAKIITEPCPYCEGKGMVRSRITVSYDIMRAITKLARAMKKRIVVETHSDIADIILDNEKENIDILESTHSVSIVIKSNPLLNYEQYKITSS